MSLSEGKYRIDSATGKWLPTRWQRIGQAVRVWADPEVFWACLIPVLILAVFLFRLRCAAITATLFAGTLRSLSSPPLSPPAQESQRVDALNIHKRMKTWVMLPQMPLRTLQAV